MLDLEFFELSDVAACATITRIMSAPGFPRRRTRANAGLVLRAGRRSRGEERGEVASRMAVESLVEGFRASPRGEAHTALLARIVKSQLPRL